MKRIAICIGNNDYSILTPLKCAVSDAEMISRSLENIGFKSRFVSNLNRDGLVNEIIGFCEVLPEYDMGLLYYAGHGFQCDSDNILAPIDLNIEKRPAEVRMDSFPLSELMQQMGKSTETTKIVILDACRESLGYRGSFRDFSPMVAPQRSIIAFSTSPGQTARENSETQHGIYTETLLNYLELPRIPIETVFKKVREQMAALTGGGQIPWEHTSLIGDIYLNPDTIYDGVTYGEDALSDSSFSFRSDSQVKEIVELMKTQNWPNQEKGIDKIWNIDYQLAGTGELFVLGRNITQAAEGNCFAAQRFIDSFDSKNTIPFIAKIHLLNGMSYEVYFDSYNRIREVYKTRMLERFLKMLESDEFYSCREFIGKSLSEIYDRPIYIPGQNEVIDVIVNTCEGKEENSQYSCVRKIESVSIKGKDCYLSKSRKKYANESIYNKVVNYREFENEVCIALAAPSDYIKIHLDKDVDIKQIGYEIPYDGFSFGYESEKKQ